MTVAGVRRSHIKIVSISINVFQNLESRDQAYSKEKYMTYQLLPEHLRQRTCHKFEAKPRPKRPEPNLDSELNYVSDGTLLN